MRNHLATCNALESQEPAPGENVPYLVCTTSNLPKQQFPTLSACGLLIPSGRPGHSVHCNSALISFYASERNCAGGFGLSIVSMQTCHVSLRSGTPAADYPRVLARPACCCPDDHSTELIKADRRSSASFPRNRCFQSKKFSRGLLLSEVTATCNKCMPCSWSRSTLVFTEMCF